jgi:hypothetical protein
MRLDDLLANYLPRLVAAGLPQAYSGVPIAVLISLNQWMYLRICYQCLKFYGPRDGVDDSYYYFDISAYKATLSFGYDPGSFGTGEYLWEELEDEHTFCSARCLMGCLVDAVKRLERRVRASKEKYARLSSGEQTAQPGSISRGDVNSGT